MEKIRSLNRDERIPGGLFVGLAMAAGVMYGADMNPVLKGSWPGYDRGSFAQIAVQGDYAYVIGSDNEPLNVFDVSNPREPRWVGGVSNAVDEKSRLAISGNWVFKADTGQGLGVIDVSDPIEPQVVVSGYEFSIESPRDVALCGDYAYVADYEGLKVVDIRYPAKPEFLRGILATSSVARVEVSGERAYVAKYGQIWVVDCSDPSHPQAVGNVQVNGGVRDLVVLGQVAFVASETNGLEIVDVSMAATPEIVGFCDTGGQASSISVDGSYAYVFGADFGLQVIDVSVPLEPQLRGKLRLPGSAVGSAVLGDVVFVTAGVEGILVVDISDPDAPALVAQVYGSGPAGLTLSGDLVYLADGAAGLRILDAADAKGIRLVGGIDGFGSATRVAVGGDLAYVVDRGELDGSVPGGVAGALRVVDVTDPARPQITGSTPFPAYHSSDIEVAAGYAYVADGEIQVFSVADPAAPSWTGTVATEGTALALTIDGNLAWVADGIGGLLAMDLTDPATPQIAGNLPVRNLATGDITTDVAVTGDFAYVAEVNLRVVDIADTANPREVALIEMDYARRVWISGHYLCAAGGSDLALFDVSDPVEPKRVGGASPGSFSYPLGEVLLEQNRVFLLREVAGLGIFEIPPVIRSLSANSLDLTVLWESLAPVRLQRSTELGQPDWQDLFGSEATNRVTLPLWGGSQFFRLVGGNLE